MNDALQAKFQAWSQDFFKANVENMSKELTMAFLNLTMMEKFEKPLPEEAKQIPMYQLCSKRSEYVGMDFSDQAMMLLTMLSNGLPGTAVMYIYALRAKQLETKQKITISYLADVFPWGFPTEAELQRLWDAQKVGGSNMLDMVMPSAVA